MQYQLTPNRSEEFPFKNFSVSKNRGKGVHRIAVLKSQNNAIALSNSLQVQPTKQLHV